VHGSRIAAPNDNFANAIGVTPGQPVQRVSTTEAGIESGEFHPGGCSSTARTVWYRYTPGATGTRVTVDTVGSQSTFDTVLNVWRGAALNDLVGVTCDNDSAGSSKSRVSFDALPGQTYYIQAGGDAPQFESSGVLRLNVTSTDHPLLTVTPAGAGTGTVTSTPAGIDCGTTCSASFVTGTPVSLTATPGPGSVFSGWSGDCTGTGACATLMTTNRSVTATFALQQHALTIDKQGPGSGTITSDPAGIACGTTCSAAFDHGTDVTLSADAAVGPELVSWGAEECPSATATCTVTVTAARTLQPVFGSGRPDLAVTALSDPPAWHNKGSSWTIADTTTNAGPAGAPASVTRFWLSPTTDVTPHSVELAAGRPVEPLDAGESSEGETTIVVPASIQPSSYHVVACADAEEAVEETDETNNCRASANTIEVVATPDLVVTAVADPPATVEQGEGFTATDTTANAGSNWALASRTRYYLSVDDVLDADDRLLSGARKVPLLAGGASHQGNQAVTVTLNTPTGTYHLLACADDTGLVAESDEANNCTASAATIEVTPSLPDLVVSSVGGLPASRTQGATFPVQDSTRNLGTRAAKASVTSFHLSADTTLDPDDLAVGTRSVPLLVPGDTSTTTTELTLDPGAPVGDYHVIACADSRGTVAEFDEENNCRTSAGKIQVTPASPDLVVTSVADPPAWAEQGHTFTASDTTRNVGLNVAAASRTRYYLSADTVRDPGDRVLPGARRVPSLGAGVSSSGSQEVTVPAKTQSGTYFLLACADDTSLVEESDETNNCIASSTRIAVGGAPQPLTVVRTGTGAGTVASSPAGIACGSTCGASFPGGTVVTLTATPAPGSAFEGWSGGGCSGTGPCVITINEATSVTATFGPVWQRFEENDAAISYTGTWVNVAVAKDSEGASRNATGAGAKASFTFTGTSIRWIARTAPGLGIAEVFVNGESQGLVDLYVADKQFQAVVFELTDLPHGTHTIEIVRTGTSHPDAAGKANINLDAFEIL
jgi:hypothetical protein